MLNLCIVIITVLYVNAMCRDVVIAKRLSQKSRKLKVFVWKKTLKNTPLSSKLHGYISYRLGGQMKGRRIIASYKFRQTVRFTWFGKYRHWNTKTRKSEEISSAVLMLWTNEFVQEW